MKFYFVGQKCGFVFVGWCVKQSSYALPMKFNYNLKKDCKITHQVTEHQVERMQDFATPKGLGPTGNSFWHVIRVWYRLQRARLLKVLSRTAKVNPWGAVCCSQYSIQLVLSDRIKLFLHDDSTPFVEGAVNIDIKFLLIYFNLFFIKIKLQILNLDNFL